MRLFIALWPDAAALKSTIAWREAVRWPEGARLAPDDNLHLTVQFIGNVPAERLPERERGVAVPAEPIALRLDRFDVWERGVAVLTPSQVPDALLRLHFQLGEALRRLELPVESRPLDLPGFFGPLISRKMAPFPRGEHEKKSIHRGANGHDPA